MPVGDLQTSLKNNQQAVAAFCEAARAVPAARWQQPRAEGKWSPAQVTEHLVKAYELSQRLVAGQLQTIDGVPRIPGFVRPLIGAIVRLTILRSGRFPKGKAPAPFQPSSSPPAQDVLCATLVDASRRFERDAEQALAAGRKTFVHPVFGTFGLAEFAQLQAYHSIHHRSQLTPRLSSPA